MTLLSLQVDKMKMKQGSRLSLDMTTLTIMRQLPQEVDPLVYNMSIEDPGDVPNQVKLHPSNERLRLGYASFTLATVENGCCVSARVVYY